MKRKQQAATTSPKAKMSKREVDNVYAEQLKEIDLHEDIVKYIKQVKESGEFHNCTREGNAQWCQRSGTSPLCGVFYDRDSSELTRNPTAFVDSMNESRIPVCFVVVEVFDKTQDEWLGHILLTLQQKLQYSLDHIYIIWEYADFCRSMSNERFLGYIKKGIPFQKYRRMHYCSPKEIHQSFSKKE